MRNKSFLITLAIGISVFLMSTTFSAAESKDQLFPSDYYEREPVKTVVTLSVDKIFPTEASDFFSAYEKATGGARKRFPAPIGVGAGVKFTFDKKYRFGAEFEISNSQISEDIETKVRTPYGTFETDLFEKIDRLGGPIFLTAEFAPIKTQFRSYAGAGFGVFFSQIKWIETVYSNDAKDYRKGGVLYSNTTLAPAFEARAGTEIGFDLEKNRAFFGGLFVEVKYCAVWQNVDIFNKIKEQIYEYPESLDQAYAIFPGYIGLRLGLTLNLDDAAIDTPSDPN